MNSSAECSALAESVQTVIFPSEETRIDRVLSLLPEHAETVLEMAATYSHPRMAIIDLGAGSALNVTEQPAGTIVGDRSRPGSRGPIDHYGLAVASCDSLEDVRARLVAAGADIGEIQRLGDSWSLFFRDPDGMELEVCAPI